MDIHWRIVFIRGFVTACLVLGILFLASGLAGQCDRLATKLGIAGMEKKRVWVLIALYAAGFFLGRLAYDGERKGFDTRAVGYYISIKTEPGKSGGSD
jgi:hypothetical protein